MQELIGKRFELIEAIDTEGGYSSLTFANDTRMVRLEAQDGVLLASIESLVEPAPIGEVMTDVFGGNFMLSPA
jgi:hypothetical protein